MENGNGAVELYRRFRPTAFKGVVGQDAVVSSIIKLLKADKFPHVSLFTGPSGVGKTTLARIIQAKLGCDQGDGIHPGDDFKEINCASARGVDMTRSLQQEVGMAPIGKCRVWCFDEVGKLTGDAQDSLLKTFEDIHRWVYFILCTTDPQKLRPTIKTRSTVFSLQPIPATKMRILLDSVIEKEGTKVAEKVVDRIIEVSEGSARKALVFLHQVTEVEDVEEQLRLILSDDIKKKSNDLVTALIFQKPKWSEVAEILRSLEGEQAEDIRRHVANVAGKIILGGGDRAHRAAFIVELFGGNWFGHIGHPEIRRAAWEIANLK